MQKQVVHGANPKMLKSEMQHQYWVTKKAVQQKLGAKEDKCVISSDSELDARIEIFKSISETSNDLCKIIDQYQERICILSQEECVFGRFLRDAGKRSKTTGPNITNTGKAISYCGQQRMCVRVPLLRLQHEVDVFRCRAVRDTLVTIQNMEKERTEYRAALAWMKSASAELDPDSSKSLDNFRVAQSHVRTAKQIFDNISMDSIQKIDLLAASRCNMFSHALVSYMSEMKQFAQKCASTFDAISNSLSEKRKYDFCVLKELAQNEGADEPIKDIVTVDKDQELFFTEDYGDDEAEHEQPPETSEQAAEKEEFENLLISLGQSSDTPRDYEISKLRPAPESVLNTIIESTSNCTNPNAEPIHLTNIEDFQLEKPSSSSSASASASASSSLLFKKDEPQKNAKNASSNSWLDLFAELDPLAKPEAFDLRLNGGRTNFQQT